MTNIPTKRIKNLSDTKKLSIHAIRDLCKLKDSQIVHFLDINKLNIERVVKESKNFTKKKKQVLKIF